MSSLSSEVKICNMALAHLGADRIASIDDTSEEAVQCKIWFEPIRDTVLEERELTFAERRFIQSPDPVKPIFTLFNRFKSPTNVIRVLTV